MIEARGLGFGYGGSPVLSDVSLSIPDGEFTLLVGANGAGKTTFLHHCNGLLQPDVGEVRVNGRPVGEDLVAARTAVGLLFQDPRDGFVAPTVREDVAFGPENLGLPRATIEERVDDALAAVHLGDRDEARIEELSGGERARVGIAGALAMAPDHLLLDEPLAGLDDRSRQAVLDRLRELNERGTGVLIAAHDLRGVWGPADRVVGLEAGEVVLDGAPAAVEDRLGSIGVRPPC